MTGFPQALVSAPTGPLAGDPPGLRAVWEVPDGWHQGRGAWGGLVLAAQVDCVARLEPARRVRTVTAQFLAPVPAGTCVLDVVRARHGSTLSAWNTTVRDGAGALLAQATVLTGGPRAADTHVPSRGWPVVTAPPAPDWPEVPTVAVAPPLGPEFAAHLSFRPLQGRPGSGDPARVLGWIGLGQSEPPVDWTPALLLGLVDAWWPTTYTVVRQARPMGTVAFSAHLLVEPADVAPGAFLLHEGTLTGVEEGFTSEQRRLWTSDGRLVVDNHQSIALIR